MNTNMVLVGKREGRVDGRIKLKRVSNKLSGVEWINLAQAGD
jgi:hypothetical protein